MLDLYNREIVGYAAEKNKNASLVEKALYSIKYDLRKIDLFNSDIPKKKLYQFFHCFLDKIRQKLIFFGIVFQ